MSSTSERTAAMSSVKLALLSQQVRRQLEGNDLLAAEPIAIIGLGCRFPGGVHTPEEYWDLLARGVDAVREIPPDRWDVDRFYHPDPYAPGMMNTRWGGFLDAIDQFDPAFFGLSPREAQRMDPQQRLVLEVASEALERAGQTRDMLFGSLTGVFLAATLYDYSQRQYGSLPEIDAHTITGNVHCIIPNRLSYLLNLQGPSIAVDTACSSSLVAIHMACQSLRNRESNLALAGGVNVVLSPEPMISLAKWGMLAADGRCKTFDARADGFVRGEGCGVLVLKRLADAIADGDAIQAVIRGSAVNQDGRSTAMTAPNGLAQQEVIRRALANAHVLPEQIGCIEAHGTGTALGDPIEVEALAEVVGRRFEGAPPVALASVKTNLGHLEAASGAAGLIKLVLCMQHEAIPPHLHFTKLNPHITLDDTRFYIPTELRPWPAGAIRRLAGVSSFGFGGTNAHVILEEAPRLPQKPVVERPAYLLPLSAQTPDALRATAEAFARALATADPGRVHDICYTASVRRSHYDQRLAVVGATCAELAERLQLFVNGEQRPGIATGRRESGEQRKTAFVFSGQGPQWWAMGRELTAQEPVFREVLERCDTLLRAYVGWSLLEELNRSEAETRLDQTEIAQPALFALQIALAALWRSWGVVPDGVVGHSVGEVAAAYVAGVLSLEDAVRVIAQRGRLMQAATGHGKMASVELPAADVQRAIAGYGDRLAIAAINAPAMTVISGEPAALDQAVAALKADGANVRPLPVNYAFHSPQMAPFAQELARTLGGLRPQPGTLPLASTVTGAVLGGAALDAAYWARNVREPVRFAAAVEALASVGCNLFLEVAPHPVLGGAVLRTLAETGREAVVTCSLRRGRPERETMLAALGEIYACGGKLDWARLLPDGGRVVDLPTYSWQRRRYWFEAAAQQSAPQRPAGLHPLVGQQLRSPALNGVVFETQISATQPAFIAEHRIAGMALMPATAYLEAARAAYALATGREAGSIEQVELLEALSLTEEQECTLQIQLMPDADGAEFKIYSLHGEDSWRTHATGRVRGASEDVSPAALDVAAVQARCDRMMTAAELYADLEARNVHFGAGFRAVEQVLIGRDEALGVLLLPQALQHDVRSYGFHPALLDAALHPINTLLPREPGATFLPVALAELRLYRAPGERLRVHARLRDAGSGDSIIGDVTIADSDGVLVAEVRGLRLQRAGAEALARVVGRESQDECLYQLEWQASPVSDTAALPPGPWLIVADRSGVGAALAQRLEGGGARCTLIPPDAALPAALDTLPPDAAPQGVVDLRALDTPQPGRDDPTASQLYGLGGALELVQRLTAARLWLVSRGAAAVQGSVVAPEQAPLLGFGAVVLHERPELACVRVDLDPSATAGAAADLLVRALAAADGENLVALRGGERYTARLVPARMEQQAERPVLPQRLAIKTRGVFDNLELRPLERRAPGPGEIEIRVHVTGLNFRDVLIALDLYPDQVEIFGEECSGEVVRVGPGVAQLRPGDTVLAMGSGSFASYLTTRADLAIRIPTGMSFVEAATIPITFLTAYYALHRLGRLQAGERVLIHAAAGGVGMAAVQLALQAGAEIYATAGSPEKRALLQSLGVQHVFDSRSLEFAEGVLAATGGHGVDLVLNSLNGEFIPRSLALLAPGGRFLEIGKRDIWTPERVAEARPDAAYFVVFLGDLSLGDPPAIQTMLQELLPQFVAGALRPLPTTVFPLRDVASAFRYMAQARHVGKVVVTQPIHREQPGISGEGTFLITGGTGGLGLLVAQRLAERGVRNLALVSRSAVRPEAAEVLDALRASGVQVRTFQADVGQAAEVMRVLDEIHATLPPLRGVIHAAGVNDDGVLAQQTWPRFAGVLAPKLAGAWHLHRLTRHLPLDCFVLFSSASALLGAAGQGNYAAANAFLDALAFARAAEGLPALSINWGPWEHIGMTARLSRPDLERLGRQGLLPLSAERGLAVFEQALELGAPQVAAIALDRGALDERPILAALRRSAPVAPAAPEVGLLQRWAATAPGMRRTLLLNFIRQEAIRVLGLPANQPVGARQPFSELGLDSLMAVELRNALGAALQRQLPATLLFDYPTSDTLADYLIATVPALASAPEAPVPVAAPAQTSLAAELAELSEEDAEALLLAELGETEKNS